jgi:CDP-diacylglycerol---glycerol-3-phosphate 3-phosphatidyltransferase
LTLPNRITFTRMALTPLILLAMEWPGISAWWAWGLFLVAAGTDWLDGWLARRLNQVSELGKFLDPLVDKLLVLAPLLVLCQRDVIPAWSVFLIVGRELTIAGWRVNQSRVSGANLWGKLKTISQISALLLLLTPLLALQPLGLIVFWISLILTLVSGALYLLPVRS